MPARKKNPVEAAARVSEAFHGRAAHSSEVITEEIREHTVLAKLGRLTEIELAHGPYRFIAFDPGVKLCYTEPAWSREEDITDFTGTQQMYIVGGDQSVDVKLFNQDPTKAKVPLGEVKRITYITAKQHLGEEDKTAGPYVHLLAEEGGQRPLLIYDCMNDTMELVGGTYRIEQDMDGGYSAGIRD